jgi:hypothetical protein
VTEEKHTPTREKKARESEQDKDMQRRKSMHKLQEKERESEQDKDRQQMKSTH